jgi:hypothetical protein
MVDDVISLLRGKGMAEEHIHTENFY